MNNKISLTLLTVLLLFLAGACGVDEFTEGGQSSHNEEAVEEKNKEEETNGPLSEMPKGSLEVSFLDVGQGDATLFQTEEAVILVDAGRHDQDEVVHYLNERGVTHIDLLVGTHPHADHIGQMPQVLDAFEVKEVWMSGSEAGSQTFEHTLEAILASEADYYEPRAGESFTVGDLSVEVIHPEELTNNLNDDSVSMNISFGEVRFILTGDAENRAEHEMLRRNNHINATILKAGHHGSSTSNTAPFIEAVNPDAAIYSAGENNQYGHPHSEVIELFHQMNIPLFGTAEHGTVTVKTDGESFELLTEKSTDNITENQQERDKSNNQEECIDINEADLEALMTIIHIGEERGKSLKELRPFESVKDLTRINGISEGRLSEIKSQGLACVSSY
ncbi:MBL fold metallo-hydrolase [Alteribacter keqinensis]|uniref:MBL fold metallo-hydrolase n=1 Tax=Alteribacter keqinensis TaxID=2483800 RepID=UPI001606165E|nr:MBL fold metallo-hydrolase [Alteribacter keqinensis]